MTWTIVAQFSVLLFAITIAIFVLAAVVMFIRDKELERAIKWREHAGDDSKWYDTVTQEWKEAK